MKIVIAPDSYKDCLSASEVAKYLAEGIKRVDVNADIHTIPLSDGGEGFVQTMLSALGGQKVTIPAQDALGRPIDAFYGILEDKTTAVIEMATASGIEHISRKDRNPMITSTYGTGQLLKDALENGCKKLIIGIGGSATNDGGTGMAMALGYRFFDRHKNELEQGGGSLNKLYEINNVGVTPLLKDAEILVACDVSNPLTGPLGATAVYGPQKGATPAMVGVLDKNLAHLADVVMQQMNIDVLELPGGGAAGGLGAGLVAFAGGRLQNGFNIVKEQTNLEEHIKQADLVFTGEGKIDGQTKQGKTPWGVAQIAQKHKKPLIAVAGVLGSGYRELYEEGFTSIFAIPEGPAKLDFCIANAPDLLADASERIFRLLKLK